MEGYIYDWTRLNGYVLKYLQHRWLNGNYGKKIYLLYGASGTGKTVYLKSVFKESAGDVRRFSSEELKNMILDKARYRKKPVMPSEKIIIVENIEFFRGRVATCYELFRLLYRWRRKGKLVICTCSTKKRPHFGWIDKYLCTVPVKPLRITGCVIKKLDKDDNLQLSPKEFYALSRMTSMLDVEEALHTRRNKIHILEAMKGKSGTHDMKLTEENFNKVDSGKKTIELRLYDEKRQKLKVGDTIIFTNDVRKDSAIIVRIVALHIFKDFSELYKRLPLEKCGYNKKTVKRAAGSDMNKYYTVEEQLLYDVIGIEFEVKQRI